MSEWIEMDDGNLPEEDERVVVWCADEVDQWLDVGKQHNTFWSDCYGEFLPVTHWKRQEPPK